MTEGPLDIVRRIGQEAAELDEFVMGQSGLADSDLYADFRQTVLSKDESHPLLGERVIVYGEPLTLSVEPDDSNGDLLAHPLAVPPAKVPAGEHRTSSGIYCGLTLAYPYDAARGENVYRVVHIVYPGSSDLCPDEHGNMQQVHYREYIPAKGSEVVPYNPVNAHSLSDMENDPIANMIDKIVLDEDTGVWRRAEEAGLSLAAALSEREHEDEQNQQRLSYLNSLGLLSEIEVVTDDFVFGDKYDYETSPHLQFNMRDSFFVVAPYAFHFLNGYERVRPGGAIALGREPELFMEGRLDDGQVVILPFQGIEGGYEA